tara:strand:+ start:1030 stop:1230 length:201 start_codon:yes stop_codon:yes gene_type:complete
MRADEESIVIEIRRGRSGMRQIVSEEMMRAEPDREDALKWLFWRCYEAFERHEFKDIENQVMRSAN